MKSASRRILARLRRKVFDTIEFDAYSSGLAAWRDTQAVNGIRL